MPPPRRHGIHYYGVLSAHATLRERVVETAGPSGVVTLRLREAARRMNIALLSPGEEGIERNSSSISGRNGTMNPGCDPKISA